MNRVQLSGAPCLGQHDPGGLALFHGQAFKWNRTLEYARYEYKSPGSYIGLLDGQLSDIASSNPCAQAGFLAVLRMRRE
jgi:hypothetical protein